MLTAHEKQTVAAITSQLPSTPFSRLVEVVKYAMHQRRALHTGYTPLTREQYFRTAKQVLAS